MRVAWISAGVSSFLAAYYGKPDRIVYIDVADQHPDSLRFLADCQEQLDKPIEVIRDAKYGASVDEVIEKVRYINGPHGAPCTLHLKKRVRQEWERQFTEPLTYIWGMDAGEQARAKRLADSSEFGSEFPLIERQLDKAACHALLAEMGIKRPAMYDMGYPNNNCVGCVKGGKGYWNAIRRDFPEVFARRARQEREIGASCINGCFLDELKPGEGRMDEVMPQCSLACLGL